MEDNIKKYLTDIGGEVVGCIHLAQHKDQWQALVNKEVDHWVP
jgi:hypothetical protein